ncbi:MAG: fimbria/pilus outer membrane usher protein [Luteimonas sp.]
MLPTALAIALALPLPGYAANDASAILGSFAPVPGDALDLYLQVTLNQTDTGRLAHFIDDGSGHLRARVEVLRRLGFVLAGRAPQELLAPDSFPGVTVRYDAARQQVSIDAPLSLLSLEAVALNSPDQGLSARADASPGLLFNYDVYGSQQQGGSNLTAAMELRAFGFGAGVFSNTAVTRAYRNDNNNQVGSSGGRGWRGETVRLDSSWQLSFPESALSLTVGDSFSGFLGWTRPVRLGGVQIGRNFALQPYRITTPLPSFLGEAAVPSEVDLYVNGLRQYNGQVPAGPFQISSMPGVTGAGTAQIVVTDAFGRTRAIDFPFYATQQLLAKGLSDWSASVGVVREDYAIRSFSYANDPVVSGNLRYGVSDRFTIEAHAEGSADLANAGAGGRWLIGRAGVVNAAYARSRLLGLRGGQRVIGYSWNNGRFNVSIDSQRSHGEYRDIAALYGAPPAQISERALAGVTLPHLGNLSASYVRLRYPDIDEARYAGLFWSQSFSRRWSANLSLNQNLEDRDDRSVSFAISMSLDGNRQASASLQRNGGRDDAVIDVSRPVPGDGDGGGIGWRLQARGGDSGSGGLAELGWINDVGRYGGGIASFAGDTYGYASASGSLVAMAGRAFASRTIDDGFAVVSTGVVPGVPVKLENRLIGTTGRDGLLLVAPLRAWQRNKLSIDPLDLPANMHIERVETLATPRDRSGIGVDFGIAPVNAAVLVLHDANNQPMPVGSQVNIVGGSGQAVVGYDGETYLEALRTHNRLRVIPPEGAACTVEFNAPATPGAIARLGPLTCLEETPR